MSLQDVVVTGTSTGIGLAVARLLVQRGVRVFGSVRRSDDAARVRAELGERFVPLTMDVKDDGAVARAAEVVRDALGDLTLGGLVNNAGISMAGPLLDQPLELFEEHLRINLTGVLRVTRAFAPLLGAGRVRPARPGRIVNMSSTSGKMGLPFLTAYCASKHGLEGLSEAMRRELMFYGIDVIVIGPGAVVTPIWDKAEARGNAYASSAYARAFEAFRRYALAQGREGLPAEKLGEVVWRALTVRAPRARYSVVPRSLLNWTLPMLPARVLDRAIARNFGLVPTVAERDA
jgi:NAD(P)-dependent dehydrogenase (short-subunit alcohol dehydrogenase family)